jgi:hypothetical protein
MTGTKTTDVRCMEVLKVDIASTCGIEDEVEDINKEEQMKQNPR